MSKKLKIGKTEVVIYPEGGHCYTSLKTKNGHKNQVYDSSNFPEILTAVFIGRKKGKDGKWYEKYTLKSIPEELKEFYLRGKLGFVNLIEELDAISQILQGRAEDGRKILYSRSINIEDVNEILGVVVDFKNKIVYQKDNPSKDINREATFGTRRKITLYEAEICSSIDAEFLEGNKLKSTAYRYRIDNLEISEKQKEIVQLNVAYHLASRSVRLDSRFEGFCKSFVGIGLITMYDHLFVLNGHEDGSEFAVRPVFYLECDIQEKANSLEIKTLIEKKKEKIAKMKENLEQEENELEILENYYRTSITDK